ncbi:unnamed protein product, partial [Mesorhabditis spiculigera]
MKLSGMANMFGEFVAIQKTPDFRLSKEREIHLNNAVREEMRIWARKVENGPRRRFFSLREFSSGAPGQNEPIHEEEEMQETHPRLPRRSIESA